MARPKSFNIRVAIGKTDRGGIWSLWWPCWKWDRLTPDEQRQAIERQPRLIERGSDEKEASKEISNIQ